MGKFCEEVRKLSLDIMGWINNGEPRARERLPVVSNGRKRHASYCGQLLSTVSRPWDGARPAASFKLQLHHHPSTEFGRSCDLWSDGSRWLWPLGSCPRSQRCTQVTFELFRFRYKPEEIKSHIPTGLMFQLFRFRSNSNRSIIRVWI